MNNPFQTIEATFSNKEKLEKIDKAQRCYTISNHLCAIILGFMSQPVLLVSDKSIS
ncbi:hypothetical protein [Staphylococcus lugdunensis]|uniref:hypothetical protein n=1 Tax=Staphylococcus lugdunensis TaxID=28035 RepID=UPI00045B05AD|nr:hypothetical protein [Staphylococcus lugdunensis]KAK56278.1 hypothetical protein SLVCU150_0282 [Staphylococcus lugdunensis VCU150]MCI2753265.1 hypothetical protein [Staphylococcus lugdunensis]MCI2813357.1 hypothetical protein [Staphylococcus lugdunensis]MCI2845496.1 hypothetical protein [Staphylococcus lugdunensis]UZW91080.1 hypothetical protein LE165_03830 [Staphylococcus lugdunensis]